jgi:hypothetical protein
MANSVPFKLLSKLRFTAINELSLYQSVSQWPQELQQTSTEMNTLSSNRNFTFDYKNVTNYLQIFLIMVRPLS